MLIKFLVRSRDIGIFRHMNSLQIHKCLFSIMGSHIFKIKLCFYKSNIEETFYNWGIYSSILHGQDTTMHKKYLMSQFLSMKA